MASKRKHSDEKDSSSKDSKHNHKHHHHKHSDKDDALVLWFENLNNDDVNLVGGKNASLGEMYHELTKKGIKIPNGFAITAKAYNYFLDEAGIRDDIKKCLDELHQEYQALKKVGKKVRGIIMDSEFPKDLNEAITKAYEKLTEQYAEEGADVAVRSSATAEDLPDASFAGQQESYLNIEGKKALLEACKKCMASLFTDRAISYREDKGFDHFQVSLSVGVMKMVRSDKAASGTMFTIDTESGFKDIVVVNGAWGLGENVVQGAVNPDEFTVFKPMLQKKGCKPIISKTLGSKDKFMVYSSKGATKNLETEKKMREKFCISDEEVLQLAQWGVIIEEHYSKKKNKYVPMDIEWAKDGNSRELYIVQARPETVQSRRDYGKLITYKLKGKVQEAEEFKEEHEEESGGEDAEVKKDLGKVKEKVEEGGDKKKNKKGKEGEEGDANKSKKKQGNDEDVDEKESNKGDNGKGDKDTKGKNNEKSDNKEKGKDDKGDKDKGKSGKGKKGKAGRDVSEKDKDNEKIDLSKMVSKRRAEFSKPDEGESADESDSSDDGEDKKGKDGEKGKKGKGKKEEAEQKQEDTEPEDVLTSGAAVGSSIAAGAARIIASINELDEFRKGEILITEMTDPDWEPILKHAAAIVTNSGGRTCHAAIIARELGIPCIVGCGDATSAIQEAQGITIDCSRGDHGVVLSGIYKFEAEESDLGEKSETHTKIMMNVADPDRAFGLSFFPCSGVGLGRLEFIINNHIGIHPLACLKPQKVSEKDRKEITRRVKGYRDHREFFVSKLAQGIGCIAAAFYPKPVIIRFSDFKTNEYANLLGGHSFEPKEDNPMLGWRGASRYYDPNYRKGFQLECEAILRVRNEFGLDNVEVMIPMLRTIDEAKRVIKELDDNGIRQSDGVKILAMCEVPANCILADEFLELLDGFSIGSNDLTQMSLGVDRDSQLINDLFDERNETVKRLISMAIKACLTKDKYCGICGQGPSDFPEFAEWLVEQGIYSMSLNSDTVIKTTLVVAKKEAQMAAKQKGKGKEAEAKKAKKEKEAKKYLKIDEIWGEKANLDDDSKKETEKEKEKGKEEEKGKGGKGKEGEKRGNKQAAKKKELTDGKEDTEMKDVDADKKEKKGADSKKGSAKKADGEDKKKGNEKKEDKAGEGDISGKKKKNKRKKGGADDKDEKEGDEGEKKKQKGTGDKDGGNGGNKDNKDAKAGQTPKKGGDKDSGKVGQTPKSQKKGVGAP